MVRIAHHSLLCWAAVVAWCYVESGFHIWTWRSPKVFLSQTTSLVLVLDAFIIILGGEYLFEVEEEINRSIL
jgi:hypothetical protein